MGQSFSSQSIETEIALKTEHPTEIERIQPLESLRGIAALSVATFHFNIGSHLNNVFTQNAWILVDYFFVLSGFVMSLSYGGKIMTWSLALNYQVKRFWRIYPLHLVTLLALVLWEGFRLGLVNWYGYQTMTEPFTAPKDPLSLLLNLVLLQNILLQDLTWNEPSWSISAEFFVYAVFAVVARLTYSKREALPWIALFLASSTTGLIWFESTDFMGGPLRCSQGFFLGVFVQTVFKKTKSHFLTILCGPVCLLTVVAICYPDQLPEQSSALFPLFFAINILLIVRSHPQSLIYRVLSIRPLTYLGRISYSVYMIHGILWYFMGLFLRKVMNVPFTPNFKGEAFFEFQNPWLADIVMGVGLILLLTLSHLSFTWIEDRFRVKSSSK